jgi:hypothetical protein
VEVTPAGGVPVEQPTPAPEPPAEQEGRLQTVLNRGNVVCGVNTNLPGFGAPEGDTWVGFEPTSARRSPRLV